MFWRIPDCPISKSYEKESAWHLHLKIPYLFCVFFANLAGVYQTGGSCGLAVFLSK